MMRTGRQAGALTVMVAGVALSGLACTGAVTGGGNSSNPNTNGKPDDSTPTQPGDKPPGMSSKPTPSQPVVPPPPVTADNAAGQAVFRRMTLVELTNTLRDLVGMQGGLGEAELADDVGTTTGFVVGARFVQAADATKFYSAIEQLTSGLAAKLGDIAPKSCDLASTDAGKQEACAVDFIDKFGLRAYRRPLNADEKTDLLDLYKALRGSEAGASFTDALVGLVRGIIQSPQFLYRWELGDAAIKDGGLVRYNSYEIASRLSYFLWASMPDTKLFDLAAANKLNDLQVIADESRRMLADAKAQDTIRNFHVQWLEIDGMDALPKDESFKDYNQAVGKAMIEETVAFAGSVLWGDKATGKVSDLFSSSSSFVNAGLAKVYGVSGVTGDQSQPVKLDPNQRAGVLTQGSFLASHADGDFDHPVKRGVTMLRHILCNPIPDPKGIDVPVLPERKPGETTREHFEQHDKIGGICSGCHNAIDPLGFAFENYDAVGGYRTMEEGKPVDSSGKITLKSGDFAFKNAIELTKKLAEAPEVRECVARNWMRYLLRREEVTEEKGSVDGLMKAFESSQWDMREMLVATTTTRAFTHRKLIDGEVTK
jgi:hypothetical protein